MEIKEEWNDLHRRAEAASFFNTFTYCLSWWDHFGENAALFILVVEDDDGRLVGLAPFIITLETRGRVPLRILKFFENRHVSRCSPLLEPNDPNVASLLANHLWYRRRRFDQVELRKMESQCPTQTQLRTALSRAGFAVSVDTGEKPLYRTAKSGGIEDYWNSRGRKFRQDFARSVRRIESQNGWNYFTETRPELARGSVARLFSLDWMSQKATYADTTYSAVEKAFCADLAERHAAGQGYELQGLEINGSLAAALLSYVSDRAIYYLIMYFDDRYRSLSIGRYLFRQAIERHWADSAFDTIDLNGNSPFVQEFATVKVELLTIKANHGSPKSLALRWKREIRQSLLKRRLRDTSPATPGYVVQPDAGTVP